MEKLYRVLKFIFWVVFVVIYPMLISIYVTLPLFVGFAGLIMVLGIEKEKYWHVFFAFLYMLNLEINLSLPIFLMPISALIFYNFVKDKLAFLKLCPVCVSIVSVIFLLFRKNICFVLLSILFGIFKNFIFILYMIFFHVFKPTFFTN